jgi:hypothetical protein
VNKRLHKRYKEASTAKEKRKKIEELQHAYLRAAIFAAVRAAASM